MCNFLHDKYSKIKPAGIGYKIFGPNQSPCFIDDSYQFEDKSGNNRWISWKKDYIGDGFCFFVSKREAFRLLKELSYYGFSDHYVYTIEYSQGLGKHIENNITVKKVYTTAICKRFQILDLVTESF